MELSWTQLKEVGASPDGSAYAEFWLSAPGSADPQVALASVVAHIGPELERLLRLAVQQTPPRGPTSGDPPAAAAP